MWELIVYTTGGVCFGFVFGKTAASNLYYSQIVKQSQKIKELETELMGMAQEIQMQDEIFQRLQKRLQKRFTKEAIALYDETDTPEPNYDKAPLHQTTPQRQQKFITVHNGCMTYGQWVDI